MRKINRDRLKHFLYMFIIISGVFFNNIGCGKELSDFQTFLKDSGYIPLDLPRNDYKPGCLLEEKGRKRIVSTSEGCFPSSEVTRHEGNLSNIQFDKITNRDYGLGLEADIKKFQKLIGSNKPLPDEVKAEFINGVSVNATMRLQNVKSEYIAAMDITNHLKQFKPGDTCLDAIKTYSPCIVIQEALLTDNLQYTFHKEKNQSIKVFINWLIATFNAQAVKEGEYDFSLNITTPQYIAFKPVEVKWEGKLEAKREKDRGEWKSSYDYPNVSETGVLKAEEVSALAILGNNLYWTTD